MKLWDRCASHNSTCSRHGKRKGSSPNRVVQKRGDPQGGVSLLWVLAFGLAVVVITEKFVFQSLRKHHLGAAEREAERQQHAMVVMEDGIAASRYRGTILHAFVQQFSQTQVVQSPVWQLRSVRLCEQGYRTVVHLHICWIWWSLFLLNEFLQISGFILSHLPLFDRGFGFPSDTHVL